MPQVELNYSQDIEINPIELFQAIEQCIDEMDDSAGICKSRAYPATSFLHTHALLTVTLIDKPHRDQDFMRALLHKLRNLGKLFFKAEYYFAVQLKFAGPYYDTGGGRT